MKKLILLPAILIFFTGCGGQSVEPQPELPEAPKLEPNQNTAEEVKEKKQEKVIEEVVGNKKVITETGLQYEIFSPGNGEVAKAGDVVRVHYTGWLLDGTKFDSSVDRGEPIEFNLGARQVIKGWDEGVAGMKIGEERRLTIPSHLAYGNNDRGKYIKAGDTLIFDVELIDIVK